MNVVFVIFSRRISKIYPGLIKPRSEPFFADEASQSVGHPPVLIKISGIAKHQLHQFLDQQLFLTSSNLGVGPLWPE